ncbi:MAG: phosphatidylglycerol lysyltransferase domain-containing protein [Christensenellaceae bacterium]|jgi:hypothetical protein|nr:phosphatidylglycerol lysyltransferase domain-containing protein [Christensenellaceae bacterium]
MLSFKRPTIDDKTLIDSYLNRSALRICEYNFTNIFIWCDRYEQRFAEAGGFLFIRLGSGYLFPVGEGDLKNAFVEIENDARAAGGAELRLVCLSKAQAEETERLFPGRFAIEPVRDSFDYLYPIGDLCELSGKKYQQKRNHIHRFEENNPDWRAEPVTPENVALCLEMAEDWYAGHEEQGEDENVVAERAALALAAANYAAMGLEGLLIRAEGRVLAFAIGCLSAGGCFDVVFEKAYGEIQGAFAIINREFANLIRERHPEVLFVNREDDMGLEGLRKAKESYHPIFEEKYMATLSLQ